jgi:hypothetical protein
MVNLAKIASSFIMFHHLIKMSSTKPNSKSRIKFNR